VLILPKILLRSNEKSLEGLGIREIERFAGEISRSREKLNRNTGTELRSGNKELPVVEEIDVGNRDSASTERKCFSSRRFTFP
jgi:hypothetical protein